MDSFFKKDVLTLTLYTPLDTSTSNHNLSFKIDSIDFNSMIENLIDPIKEKKEIKKFNIIKSNIGKKLNVVVVYQEDSSQDNTNYFEEKDSFNNEKEQDPNNIIVQL